ncbi:MAG: 50S ribosomal protein L30 [Clostridia bacterium]|nr:50S ribosomal protein L30 [Clostridia bacterium]MDD4679296.1 50S ribosomal protein L30 [Clostridia bacterium]
MAKLKVTQTRSTIGRLKNQIATMEALGLKKIGSFKIHDDNAVIKGMIDKVKHLVSVEEIEG